MPKPGFGSAPTGASTSSPRVLSGGSMEKLPERGSKRSPPTLSEATCGPAQPTALSRYDLEGRRNLRVPVPEALAQEQRLALRPQDGSLWLSRGSRLLNFTAAGELAHSFQVPGLIHSLHLEAEQNLLKVGFAREIRTFDAVTGLEAAPVEAVGSIQLGNLSGVRQAADGSFWALAGPRLQLLDSRGRILSLHPPLGPEAQLQLLAQDSIPSPRGSPPTPTSLGSAAPAGSWLASPFQAERQSSAWLCSLSSRKPRPPRPPARTPPNQLESRKKHLPARP